MLVLYYLKRVGVEAFMVDELKEFLGLEDVEMD
jgi:hypothetical protein